MWPRWPIAVSELAFPLMAWWHKWQTAADALLPRTRLFPPAGAPRITWVRDGDTLRSDDGEWTIRTVVQHVLSRRGLELGPYDDLEQAQTRAELDEALRDLCPGSLQKPWRISYDEGECVECCGFVRLRADGTVVKHTAGARRRVRASGE